MPVTSGKLDETETQELTMQRVLNNAFGLIAALTASGLAFAITLA